MERRWNVCSLCLIFLFVKQPDCLVARRHVIANVQSLACNETNLIHYLSSANLVTIPLHVSGLVVAHHQEVTMYICDNWYVLYF
jgi:hypothetical protein